MRVFLSYHTVDYPQANRVQIALKQRRPDLDIYFAPRRNDAGAYWIKILGEKLDAADVVLLLLGGGVGAWQELEYYEALKRHRKTDKPLIVPVLLGNTAPKSTLPRSLPSLTTAQPYFRRSDRINPQRLRWR